ncbi:MAG TPA: hypothetical protein VGA40_07535 [Candidatus Acidoferrales bacterium]
MTTAVPSTTNATPAGVVGVWLAVGTSIVTGTAHLGLKWTANAMDAAGGFTAGIAAWLAVFYVMQAGALLLYTLALRRGALSTIYPVLSLRYFWVIGLGVLLFPGDTLNVYKIAGAALVVLGVMAVARGGMNE